MYAPPYFIKSSIITIPKSARANLTDCDKHRSIAISSSLSNLLDYVIIKQQNISLKTPDYHFNFKHESSAILCTIIYGKRNHSVTFLESGGKAVHLLLLDSRKAFKKVAYDMLFKVLLKKMYVQKLIDYHYICIPINDVMFSGEMLALLN